MCAQLALKEEQFQSRQGDFRGSLFSSNGDGVQLFSGEDSREEQLSSEVRAALKAAFIGSAQDDVGEEQTITPVVVEGALVVSARFGEIKAPTIARGDRSADGDVTISFYDHAETLLLQIVSDTGTLNIKTQYTDKPLGTALTSARFFEMLATTPGLLSFEVNEVVGEGETIPHRIEVADLPFHVPEPQLEEYRNRLQLLEGLYDIWINTGIEIRYPANTDDEEGLRNYNFVLKAVRGGWVALSIANFDVHVPADQAPILLDELRAEGQVGRAFYFEVPNESYRVFDKEVNLGPSSRYLAAARLATTEEEIKDQLSTKGDGEATLDLTWEPIGDRPMHVFFDQWPRVSVASVRQDLMEYETVYRVSSQRFKQAWEQREPWVQEIPDGNRWFSLIQAYEELAAES